MKFVITLFLFLNTATPIYAREIKVVYGIKTHKQVSNKPQTTQNIPVWYRVASYKETNDTWELFVNRASKIAQDEDFPLSVILGQAALESGRGTSYLSRTRYNFFGINAVDWNPNLATEYASVEDGIHAYINLIKNHYKIAYANKNNPYKMLELIKSYGYASDPNYVGKVRKQPEFYENL